MVIEAFLDDSGKESEPNNRIVVMAGYAAGADLPWRKLNHAWRHLLFKHKLPDIHLKEIVGHAKRLGWDMPTLNNVLLEFIDAIKDADLVGFGIAVDADAYRVLPKKRRQKFGDAQEFCFSRILRNIREHTEALGNPDEEVTITFDQDFEFARRRITLIEELSRWAPEVKRNLVQLGFAKSKYFYPLQAADLLVWETRRQILNRLDNKPSTPRWNDLMTALPYGELKYSGEFWTASQIEEKFSELEERHEREIVALREKA